MYQFNFNFEEFLAEYWQKKPTIIKGGFKNFVDPISPDELAGLAMEDEVDSRYIAQHDDEWDVKHGPLTFDDVPEDHWSFIVQAANHWHEGAAQLITPFRQLPNWLMDDLMISYSTPGGGVGPHIDQYDVFITQGSGKRHWRVGPKREDYEEEFRHPALRQIKSFEPIIDDVLEPGDILYIPPGFPHDGYAIETSMSFSVGFRSPKKQELLSSFADHVIANEIGDVHYHNPDLPARQCSGAILDAERQGLENMLRSLLDHPQLMKDWMGEHLSNNRHELDLIAAEPQWENSEVREFLTQPEVLKRLNGLRAFYYPETPTVAYIHGERFTLPSECEQVIPLLCDHEEVTGEMLGEMIEHPAVIDFLTQLINQGYWYPAE
ncbi:50S ribosomal protein L16 arginine hydroxylase [Photobacterium jeanii]|uniref:50S ribosomal protein L16 arginine hydroxylase n=1 Tax=Photobacterium jeanii TaxID=858640 RepID=A0A178KMD2_9GAMM|nr:cupin domain-containing protein [Photobacterium jeanii]OAN18401.1 50S ribosomal protein L16 arginine hydroxylase [Photobacterium jeanii]PST91918.1 cupin domain-containing protein [Photobacterium jeanii]